MRIGLVGGGIGGLTAAVALRQFGFDIQIFEQAGVYREVGAALGVGPNAVKVLRQLGLEGALTATGYEAERFEGRNWTTGEILFQRPMKGFSKERYAAGHYQIHRADLLDILARSLPPNAINLNARCSSVTSENTSATVTLSDGQTHTFDLVVGCDGLRSIVRLAVHGEDTPRFTGNMCWRALIPTNVLPPHHIAPQMTIWIGLEGHIVTYYVRGGELVNLVAFHTVSSDVEESWSIESTTEELLSAYPEVHPDVRLVLQKAKQSFKWGLFDRDPYDFWSRHRVTLLGDAAHPMLPFLGQGAATAIEDAYVLG